MGLPRFFARALALALTVATGLGAWTARDAHADCTPPFCFQTQVTAPPVNPSVSVTPGPVVVQPPSIDPRLEAARVESWRAYFEWVASIRARVSAEVLAQADGEAEARARATPDRWGDRFRGPGQRGLPRFSDYRLVYPRFEAEWIAGVVTVWSGRFRPLDAGTRPSLRVRIDDTWGFALDGSFEWSTHDLPDRPTGPSDLGWSSLGVHPAAIYTLARGGGHLAASNLYARVGFDLWAPLSGGAAVPDAFLGVHAGLGAYLEGSSPVGMALELLGDGRAGSAPRADAPEGISALRAGFTARLSLFSGAFD